MADKASRTQKPASMHVPGEELVANSGEMRKALALAQRVASVETPVLITGESGTGKEWVARYIHSLSPRARGPFLPINCGALPENLLESELFGYVKGAFTGAERDHQGLFEAARGGILFLDEIGEIPLGLQVKFLRVLQDRQVRRIGSTESHSVDVRVIAATNRNLEEMVRSRAFRKDLYYRLKVIEVEVPPLRLRREDILPLARNFIQRHCQSLHCGPCSLSAEALDLLLQYPWPGNVRELEHAMERAVVLAEGKPTIEVRDLPPEVMGASPPSLSEDEIVPLAEMERRYILRALEKYRGNQKATAKALGIGANTLWRRLRSYGLVKKRSFERGTP